MARKAIVDKNIVLKLLKEGKSSQTIASRFGVSRQAIDLYRKEFVRTGFLSSSSTSPLPVTSPLAANSANEIPRASPPLLPVLNHPEITLDQMIELLIKALDALKRLPELEAEAARCRADYENLVKQVEQLQEREKKRKEQETRWLHAQNPGILTNRGA